MKTDCKNKFCIYFDNNFCIMDTVSLDERGICDKSIPVDVDEELLDLKRKKLLEKIKQVGDYYPSGE
ncbi:MAG: hypothetical protein FWF08_08460 [Oscillospiraceae bacterium]|nr:hypothetical protein [Oscillospiraceae bacterium]